MMKNLYCQTLSIDSRKSVENSNDIFKEQEKSTLHMETQKFPNNQNNPKKEREMQELSEYLVSELGSSNQHDAVVKQADQYSRQRTQKRTHTVTATTKYFFYVSLWGYTTVLVSVLGGQKRTLDSLDSTVSWEISYCQSSLGPLPEQQALLTTESSLDPKLPKTYMGEKWNYKL